MAITPKKFKNGVIIHSILNGLAAKYEAERLIDAGEYTEEEATKLIKKLRVEEYYKKDYAVTKGKGHTLTGTRYYDKKFRAPEKLNEAIKIMEKELKELYE